MDVMDRVRINSGTGSIWNGLTGVIVEKDALISWSLVKVDRDIRVWFRDKELNADSRMG